MRTHRPRQLPRYAPKASMSSGMSFFGLLTRVLIG
jgi:hypothetical protein